MASSLDRASYDRGMDDAPQEPRWLTDEEMHTWHKLASVLIRLPAALDAQLQRDAGISRTEYGVMSALSASDERTMRMSELSALTDFSLSRLSRVAARLEKQGWMRRTPDPTDGRVTLAILTPAGWDKVVASAPGHASAVRDYVIAPLTKAQVRQLGDITHRIMNTIPRGCPSKD